MGPALLPAPLSPSRGPRGELGARRFRPEGLCRPALAPASGSFRWRFGSEGRSLLPSRALRNPKPNFTDGLSFHPIWREPKPFAISSASVRKSGHADATFRVHFEASSAISKDRLELNLFAIRAAFTGISIDPISLFISSLSTRSEEGFASVRQDEIARLNRVVQAARGLFFHRSFDSRWTTRDKPVRGCGSAAPANDSCDCESGMPRPQPPRLASSLSRSALSLMKPSASF